MPDLLPLIASYPELTRDSARGASVSFVPMRDVDDTITSAYAVPYLDMDSCVAVRRQDGNWTIPGGTLEEGEGWQDALHRELREEIGAEIRRFEPVGAYRIAGPTTTFRIFCWAEVDEVGAPTEPETGPASIVGVTTLSPQDAPDLFKGRFAHLGSVYSLANDVYRSSDR